MVTGCQTSHAHLTKPETAHAHGRDAKHQAGSPERLRSALSGTANLEVLISDVRIPPGAALPPHYHPGEEFIYVLEGTALHREEGQADRVYEAGEAFVIAPGRVHSPKAGEGGTRAIVFRVHPKGDPERILVK